MSNANVIVVTTPTVPGREIARPIGLVTGDAIMGANVFRDVFAGIRDLVGGRSAAYEKELNRAKAMAIGEMVEAAAEQGANAVVGVDLDFETVGPNGSMLMVSASGTAVVSQ
jgi:uncharacterized protein YbjQ (UPF0145 family)